MSQFVRQISESELLMKSSQSPINLSQGLEETVNRNNDQLHYQLFTGVKYRPAFCPN